MSASLDATVPILHSPELSNDEENQIPVSEGQLSLTSSTSISNKSKNSPATLLSDLIKDIQTSLNPGSLLTTLKYTQDLCQQLSHNIDHGQPPEAAAVSSLSQSIRILLSHLIATTISQSNPGARMLDVDFVAGSRAALSDIAAALSKLDDYMKSLKDQPPANSLQTKMDQKLSHTLENDYELLREARYRLEIALEFEELHGHVIPDLRSELNTCLARCFEINEMRREIAAHKPELFSIEALKNKSLQSVLTPEKTSKIDVQRADETASKTPPPRIRPLSLDEIANAMVDSPLDYTGKVPKLITLSEEEKNANLMLLQLIARMQPLKASLDIVPLKKQSYETQASELFPTSVEALNLVFNELMADWKKLDSEVQFLKHEMSDEKWALVFKTVIENGSELIDSMQRTIDRLDITDSFTQQLISDSSADSQAAALKYEEYQKKKCKIVPTVLQTITLLKKGRQQELMSSPDVYERANSFLNRWAAMSSKMLSIDATLFGSNSSEDYLPKHEFSYPVYGRSGSRSSVASGSLNTPTLSECRMFSGSELLPMQLASRRRITSQSSSIREDSEPLNVTSYDTESQRELRDLQAIPRSPDPALAVRTRTRGHVGPTPRNPRRSLIPAPSTPVTPLKRPLPQSSLTSLTDSTKDIEQGPKHSIHRITHKKSFIIPPSVSPLKKTIASNSVKRPTATPARSRALSARHSNETPIRPLTGRASDVMSASMRVPPVGLTLPKRTTLAAPSTPLPSRKTSHANMRRDVSSASKVSTLNSFNSSSPSRVSSTSSRTTVTGRFSSLSMQSKRESDAGVNRPKWRN
ncbi:hypothetical protein CANCADRAFT_71 [Tortispora caseinolytica NRRL Y-17796]|uniref:Karyogamy protein n=1 Tax=Tortispora caseinolytica NRRL Y-17796 TaxID=767744 RepID=A0A1E4TID4_9ASCO|nr:hypothetical protein CANCADRAFT_71 [Tortispora caseinolytica NRRL Y-17796]